MIYNKLAELYDGLVKDDEATSAYVSFLNEALPNSGNLLELGCGSAEITQKLALNNPKLKILATDLSQAMLDKAISKQSLDNVTYEQLDMNDLTTKQQFDGIFCICDSINYLTPTQFKNLIPTIYKALTSNGVFVFDMHHEERLTEFKNEFYEAGIINNTEYTWSIISEGNQLIQNFIFYDEKERTNYEQHIQYVFDHKQVINWLKDAGFSVDLYSDAVINGENIKEKYFLVCRKGVK